MPSGAYFFSVRAKNAGGEHCDRLREKVSSSERKEKSDEPHSKLSKGDPTLVSAARTGVSRVSSEAAGGDDADQTDRDQVGWSYQADPRGLSLSGCGLSGTPADVPQPGGRCAGPALLHVWTGHRAAGRTAAPGEASDGGRDPSGTAGAAGTAGGDDGAARNPLPV